MTNTELSAAIADGRAAIEKNPCSADLQIILGQFLQKAREDAAAVECYRRALKLDPKSYAAFNGLGTVFGSLRDWPTAITFFRAAIVLNPDQAEIYNNLANVFLEQEQIQPAIDYYQKAIALQPDTACYYNHLGNALRQQQDFAAAELCLRKALSLHPNYAEAYVNLGFLSLEQEDLEAAENYYREAIRLQPDCALAHTCLGRILLRKGDFEAGWPEQEWRWQWKDFPSPHRNFAQPQWKGEAIGAARIFLHAEQGFGDTLQFLRYVPLVIDRLRDQGASILLEVHPELHRLAETIPGVTQLISRGDAIPDFDWHCPLMSLPMAFATTLNTLPAGVPYLHADAFPAECALSNHSRAECEPLRVGVAWAGSTIDRADKKRSISLSLFAPLFAVAGVSCYGLQRGFAFSEAESLKFPFVGHLDATGDFGTTAGVISRLDLIISVDTAVAHLAGALGKPVWILLPKPADWRWLADRSDSPWYPSAKLFRQKTAGDWESVIAEVAAALEHTVAARNFAEV